MIKQIPNMLTVSRLLFLPIFVFLLWEDNLVYGWYAAGLMAFTGLLDMVDGFLARLLNAESNTGKILDPMADKLVVLVALLMLLHLNRISVIIPILLLAREIIIITLRAVAASEGIVIPAGVEGKKKTAFQMFGLGGLFIYYDFFGANAKYCGTVLLILSVAAAWYSAFVYIKNFLPHWTKVSSLGDE